jgi:hypothetical protein
LQVEYKDRTLYNCGTDYYPKDYLTNPACVALPPDTLKTQLKLQRGVTEWPWEAVALVSLFSESMRVSSKICDASLDPDAGFSLNLTPELLSREAAGASQCCNATHHLDCQASTRTVAEEQVSMTRRMALF